MKCQNCGKEINNDLKFCENCGEVVTVAPIAKKKKSGKKTIIIIVAIVIVAFFAVLFGLDEDGANDNPSVDESAGANVNSLVTQTGEDDIYGGVAFNLTLDEFVEKYNASLGEYEGLEKLSMSNFKSIKSDSGTSAYSYDFGYTSGTTYNSLAGLVIVTNDATEKIQAVKYIWKMNGYNTDDAKNNYYFTKPARIFSFFYDEIDYPVNKDYSSYYDLFMDLYEQGDETGVTRVSLENTTYGFFNTGNDNIMGIQFLAMTSDSEMFAKQTEQ